MNDVPTLINTLEDLLVQEFRTCQSIHELTKEERQALSRQDIQSLSNIVEQKEVLLDELGQIEDRRRMIMQNLGDMIGLKTVSPTIADISKRLTTDAGGRISRLKDGISALAEEIKIMSSGNRALAIIALERIDALQTILLDTFRPSLVYDRPGAKPTPAGEAVWDVDQRV
jgi:flagellar biosynthesis/type III secretory pathway chaperone